MRKRKIAGPSGQPISSYFKRQQESGQGQGRESEETRDTGLQNRKGEEKVLPTMFNNIEAFQRKLTLISAHLSTNNLVHFAILSKMATDVDPGLQVYRSLQFGDFLDGLAQEFESRFSECQAAKTLFQFVVEPISFQPETLGEFIARENLAAAQMELLELQCDIYIKAAPDCNRKDCLAMWRTIGQHGKYPLLSDIAKKVLSMFGSTYRCESAFSHMKAIKTKYRNRISDDHLMQCVRAVTTKYKPLFNNLTSGKQAHGSC